MSYVGQTCTLAIKKIKRNVVRRGMVLLGPDPAHGHHVADSVDALYEGCSEFMAEVYVLHHSTTIHRGYQSVIHANSIAQIAAISDIKLDESGRTEEIGDGIMRSGDRALVKFRFVYRPEYLTKGTLFVFREGGTRGVGRVTEVFPLMNDVKKSRAK